MGIFSGCLLASDIDGTLMTEGKVPARNLEAIQRFQQEGGLFTIATGRSTKAVLPVFDFIRCNCPAIVYNGGMIYDYEAQQILYERALSSADKRLCAELVPSFPQVGIEVHSGSRVYLLNRSAESDWHEAYERITPTCTTVEAILDQPWNKVFFALDREETFDDILRLAEPKLRESGTSYIVKTYATDRGSTHYACEQMPAGVNKGTALPELARLTGVKPGHVFAIGDYYNDVELLAAADVSAVPVESPEALKRDADFICGSCAVGAVADFIEYIESKL